MPAANNQSYFILVLVVYLLFIIASAIAVVAPRVAPATAPRSPAHQSPAGTGMLYVLNKYFRRAVAMLLLCRGIVVRVAGVQSALQEYSHSNL